MSPNVITGTSQVITAMSQVGTSTSESFQVRQVFATDLGCNSLSNHRLTQIHADFIKAKNKGSPVSKLKLIRDFQALSGTAKSYDGRQWGQRASGAPKIRQRAAEECLWAPTVASPLDTNFSVSPLKASTNYEARNKFKS